MIPVEIENKEFLKETLHEDCIFCKKEGRYWHKESNTPMCRGCAKVKSVNDMYKVKYQKEN